MIERKRKRILTVLGNLYLISFLLMLMTVAIAIFEYIKLHNKYSDKQRAYLSCVFQCPPCRNQQKTKQVKKVTGDAYVR